jgi:hypothetical protein
LYDGIDNQAALPSKIPAIEGCSAPALLPKRDIWLIVGEQIQYA